MKRHNNTAYRQAYRNIKETLSDVLHHCPVCKKPAKVHAILRYCSVTCERKGEQPDQEPIGQEEQDTLSWIIDDPEGEDDPDE